jgi:spore coat protein U-like protein
MKKLLAASAMVIGLSIASPAFAADSATLDLEGELSRECEISTFQNNGDLTDIDMTSTAQTPADSVTINCNYGGTASVEFASANAGNMVSGPNSVPYTAFLSGGFGSFSLATPHTVSNFPAVAGADQTRGFSIALDTPATVPGEYTDTVTATVTPN